MDSIPRCYRILRKIVLVISQKKKDKKKKNGEGKNIWVVFKLAINTIRMINSVIFKDICTNNRLPTLYVILLCLYQWLTIFKSNGS